MPTFPSFSFIVSRQLLAFRHFSLPLPLLRPTWLWIVFSKSFLFLPIFSIDRPRKMSAGHRRFCLRYKYGYRYVGLLSPDIGCHKSMVMVAPAIRTNCYRCHRFHTFLYIYIYIYSTIEFTMLGRQILEIGFGVY